MSTEKSSEGTQRSSKQRVCPKCQTFLTMILSGGVEGDTCPSCNGIWLDRMEEKDFLQFKPEVFSLDDILHLRKFYQPSGKLDPVRYVPCPICGEMMNRIQWASFSGVVVDRCEDHGTWYDAGELEKIQEFVSIGGLELEKYRTLDKRITNVDIQLSQEVTRIHEKIDNRYQRARLYGMLGF